MKMETQHTKTKQFWGENLVLNAHVKKSERNKITNFTPLRTRRRTNYWQHEQTKGSNKDQSGNKWNRPEKQ